MDMEISESGKKKLRIQKYPDTCGRGLNSQDPNPSRCYNDILKEIKFAMFRRSSL